ncbi:HYR-like domain-containing protein, partial [Maribellus mangrovi]|uniref:HYR-like domain-containing protein n=1 Tax=Maribellus mangrovi TaxID=3133146 RepID=UPI0030EF33DF
TTGDQVITIYDDTAPTLIVPVEASFECELGDAGTATAEDNCDDAPVVTFTDSPDLDECGLGLIIRTWKAEDCAGNTTTGDQVITIYDDTAPTLIVPVEASFECELGDAGTATAEDNCDDAPVVTFTDSPDLDECGLGLIIRTWKAEDCAGNTTTGDQVITIYDDTAPTLIVPVEASFECELGDAGTATAEDNC